MSSSPSKVEDELPVHVFPLSYDGAFSYPTLAHDESARTHKITNKIAEIFLIFPPILSIEYMKSKKIK